MSRLDAAILAIDAISDYVGRTVAWLVVAMVTLTVFDVTMRYGFRRGSVALQELEWHMFSLVFLLGAAYTLKERAHVRVDLIYASKWVSDRQRLIIDVIGNLLFLLPFCGLLIWSSAPFVYAAMVHGESSPDPGGLPYRWVLKAGIPLGFALIALQGLADTARGILELRRRQST
jgi:TRAP-type mannitol/chloroaromatic compound transport system permease small subunit